MLINRFKPRFCMNKEGGEGGGAAAGAPTTATTNAATGGNESASATTGTTAGEVAKANGTQTSATATVPAGVGQQAADTTTSDFRAGWTDDLKNDPSLKDFKDTASMAKALIDTKKLVGQKLGIPGPDATPEAKAAFFEALGVPKDPAGYEFKAPADMPEAMKAHYDQAHADKWAGVFQKHGIPKEAANALRNELFKEITGEIGEMQAAADTSDAQFKELAVSIYGDEAKATAGLQSARTMIEKHLPPALKGALNQLSNTALLAVAAAIGGETKALTGEDKTISRETGTGSDGKTSAQLREEARAIMALPEYSSAFTAKGKGAHEKATADVKAIYARINGMGGK